MAGSSLLILLAFTALAEISGEAPARRLRPALAALPADAKPAAATAVVAAVHTNATKAVTELHLKAAKKVKEEPEAEAASEEEAAEASEEGEAKVEEKVEEAPKKEVKAPRRRRRTHKGDYSEGLPPLEQYVPDCVEHLKELVDMLDREYTDVQLHSALDHECWLDKVFPHFVDTGFNHHEACHDFADRLTQARFKEIEDDDDRGYYDVCVKFHNHKSGLPYHDHDHHEYEHGHHSHHTIDHHHEHAHEVEEATILDHESWSPFSWPVTVGLLTVALVALLVVAGIFAFSFWKKRSESQSNELQ